MDIKTIQLSNGIRVVHQQNKSAVSHCGLIINSGTRDELASEHGLAHFIEHVLFKGTHKRKTYHINSRLEDLGGELNAYTSKEETTIHSTVLKTDYEKAVELIADIAFNSTFPVKELEKEKDVIIDEINSYKDSPADSIFDDFEDLIFSGSSLGRNILGTKKLLKKFTKENIINFIARTYNTDQMVFSSIGKINHDKAFKLAERYLSAIPANPRIYERDIVNQYTPFYKEVSKNTYQTHCVIGNRGYEFSNPEKIPLLLLTNILGGPAPNSRLNSILREKHGLTYNVEASYTPYSDTGIFTVYFGTDKANFAKCHSLVIQQIDKICTNKLGVMQLHRAKKQVLGQLAISSESNEQQMLSNGKSILVYNAIDSMEEIASKINAITAEKLLETANTIYNTDNLSTLIYT